jgi:predicted alpha/beta-fold hydrolase
VKHYISGYCSISNPFDLKKALKNSSGHLVMNNNIMKLCKAQIGDHLHEEAFVKHCKELGIDLEVAMKSKTVLEFEERFSRRIFGYYERDHYHEFVSCV